MMEKNGDLRAAWTFCMMFCAAFTANCAQGAPASERLSVDQTPDALSAPQLECERTKRECLVTADCDADKREACESAFRTCDEPLRAERDRVHDMCRTERETCEAAATDDAARHACHMAEHKCTLPVDPPDAVCHVDAEECVWNARGSAEPTMPPAPPSAAERACRDKEHECHDAMHEPQDVLPTPPKCPPPAPPACAPDAPDAPAAEPPAPPAAPGGDPACERTKRECLVAASCDNAKRETCESAFRTCDAPARAERDRVHDMCREARESCEAAAGDDDARHACHVEEHKCTLPVEPPDAVCHVDAEECVWNARAAAGAAQMPEPMTPPAPMMPPAPAPAPMMPPAPAPMMPPAPAPMMPPALAPMMPPALAPMMPPAPESDAERACHDEERACHEAKRPAEDDLPKPPMCPPAPPKCKPA